MPAILLPAVNRFLLLLILLGYLALGALFAVLTPPWQAPDEPAHYNYVRYLAENGQFPVLHPGDYPHAYLEEIKARGFPPDMPIEPIRYEFHQPPLYYALAAPVFRLTGGALIPLRLFSVLLGAGIVVAAYALAREIVPAQPAIALGAAAVVAFLPQHLATVSQVGNDVLAELLVALALLALVGWAPPARPASGFPWRQIGLGALLGLILITKTTAYVVLPLALAVMVWRWVAEKAPPRRIVSDLLLVGGAALIIALPWFARNIAVYGWPDLLGLRRHDEVVVGQLRTAAYLAQNGMESYIRRLGEFTFKSFWGVFGWLGIFMDSRVYLVLALLSFLAVAGLAFRSLVWPARTRGAAKRAAHAPAAAAPVSARLLLIPALFTVIAYGWYNVQFVQHQGRYLFTALLPIALGLALGWDEAVQTRTSRWLAAGLAGLGVAIAVLAFAGSGGLPGWPLALTAAAAAGMAVAAFLPDRLRPLAYAFPFVLLPLVALYAILGPVTP